MKIGREWLETINNVRPDRIEGMADLLLGRTKGDVKAIVDLGIEGLMGLGFTENEAIAIDGWAVELLSRNSTSVVSDPSHDPRNHLSGD